MADLSVRRATIKDVPAIRSVARDACRATYEDIIGEEAVGEVVDTFFDHEELRSAVRNDEGVVLVAGERAKGFVHAAIADAGLWMSGDRTWELVGLYVRSRHWNEGIGSTLLDAVESALRDRRVDHYELSVLVDNEAAVDFFESRGCERTGTEEGDLGGVEISKHTYRKEL